MDANPPANDAARLPMGSRTTSGCALRNSAQVGPRTGLARLTRRATALGGLTLYAALWLPDAGIALARGNGDPGNAAALASLAPPAASGACLRPSAGTAQAATPDAAQDLRAAPGCDAAPLPLDMIGLRVASLAVAVGGSGYAAGDTITLEGGAVVRVAALAGSAVARVSIVSPGHAGCADTAAGALRQRSASGSGRGARFTATFLRPVGLGARLLTRCYVARRWIDVQQGDGVATLGFARDGAGDTATLDTLFPGGAPRVATWYDQGGGGADAVNAPAYRPTISPLRAPGGTRSIVYDGDPNGPGDSGAPGPIVSLNWPAAAPTASVDLADFTAFVVTGFESLDHRTGLLNIGGVAAATPTANIGLRNLGGVRGLAVLGAREAVACPGSPLDSGNVVVMVGTAAGDQCILNGAASAVGGGAPAHLVVSGGSLGYGLGGAGVGGIDQQAVIVVPWAMTAAQIAATTASLERAFGIRRDATGLIVFDGDSDTDGHGDPAQRSWPRVAMQMLARPEFEFVDTANFGSPVGEPGANGAGSRLGEFAMTVAVALRAAPARVVTKWVVLGPMGWNDFNRGDEVDGVRRNLVAYCDLVHAAGAKCALVVSHVDPAMTGRTAEKSRALEAYELGAGAAALHADLFIVQRTFPSYSAPWVQSDGIHAGPNSVAYQARSVADALAEVLR